MKLVKYLMPLLMAAGFTSVTVFAQQQETAFERQLNERDDQPLREFVQSKENIDVKKKSNNLDISGDIRFEWRSIREKGVVLFAEDDCSGSSCSSGSSSSSSSSSNSYSDSKSLFFLRKDGNLIPVGKDFRNLRGGNHVDARGLPISNNDFDVEFNLKLKYSFGRAWAAAQLQFDNPAGIRGRNDCFGVYPVFNHEGSEVESLRPRNMKRCGKGSGEANAINLKRAYMGYNVWADGKHRFDIEIGRRKLDDVFDSEIQFSSRFDGVLLKFASAIDEVTDWYWEAAMFVIDERVNHYGWVTEIGVLNLFDTGLDIRYSFIDWQKVGRNRCFKRNPYGMEFRNSQITLTYTITPEFFCKTVPVEFYSGFLVNHAAKANRFTNNKKKNLGAYAGVYVGEVKKEGDWSFDIEYIYVQAQAVSDFDVGSIGRGNILDENMVDIVGFQDFRSGSGSSSDMIGYYPRRGNANFKGWRFEFLYAITDNFSIDTIFEFSKEEDKRIGGRHRYNDFEIEAIYAF